MVVGLLLLRLLRREREGADDTARSMIVGGVCSGHALTKSRRGIGAETRRPPAMISTDAGRISVGRFTDERQTKPARPTFRSDHLSYSITYIYFEYELKHILLRLSLHIFKCREILTVPLFWRRAIVKFVQNNIYLILNMKTYAK